MTTGAFVAGLTTSFVASGYVLWELTMRRSLVEVTKAREAHENFENAIYIQNLSERIRQHKMNRDDWVVEMAKGTINQVVVQNAKQGLERLFSFDARKALEEAKKKADELQK